MSREALDGALLAVEEINAEQHFGFSFDPVFRDPGGKTENYKGVAESLFRESGCRQIVGTITSSGRKAVVPVVEKHDGLLWYTCPYEGFECSENVIYGGTCPNQHIIPLFRHLIPRYGNRVYVIGSDYVWGWENSRITHDLIDACGGSVLGDHFLPLDSTDIEPVIEEIRSGRPCFIFNNLVGATGYAFLRAYHAASRSDPDFALDRRPIVSAELTECEIDEIGLDASFGLLSSSPYFHTLDMPEAAEFRARVAKRFGPDRRMSAFGVCSYIAVHALAKAIAEVGPENNEAVKRVHYRDTLQTPMGPMRIDPKTNHATFAPHLGRVRGDGNFDIIERAEVPIVADPYLADFDRRDFAEMIQGASNGGTRS
jgi:branched-chain amino acid transport system substrate-binding protein